MKYDTLLDNITEDEYRLIRHDQGRKVGSFADVQNDEKIEITADLMNRLGVLDMSETDDPNDDLPEEYADSVFVARLPDGKLFLVNTEGYNYCRYVAPCVIADAAAEQIVYIVVRNDKFDEVFSTHEAAVEHASTLLKKWNICQIIEKIVRK